MKFIGRAEMRRYRGTTLVDETQGSLITYENTTDVFTVNGQPGGDRRAAATASTPGGRGRTVLSPRGTASAPAAAAAATPALPAALLVCIGGVTLAHLLTPGPGPDRVSAAMASVSRHPGVAITLASVALGGAQPELLANVLLFLMVGTVVLAIYQVGSAREGR